MLLKEVLFSSCPYSLLNIIIFFTLEEFVLHARQYVAGYSKDNAMRCSNHDVSEATYESQHNLISLTLIC